MYLAPNQREAAKRHCAPLERPAKREAPGYKHFKLESTTTIDH